MDERPTLSTERLLLRWPAPEDAERCLRFALRNREHLAPWEPLRPDAYFTLPFWRQELERRVLLNRLGAFLQFMLLPADDPDGEFLGHCTFSGIVWGAFQAAYLGYALNHAAVGGGLMQEALTAAIAHAFGDLNLHRLMANHMPENARSAALLDRLGFVREGLARDYLCIAGAWRDHVLTSLTNPAWDPLAQG